MAFNGLKTAPEDAAIAPGISKISESRGVALYAALTLSRFMRIPLAWAELGKP